MNLSPRELEVMALVADGATDNEIGAKLGVSRSTTKRHMANIFVKLKAKNRAHAAVMYVRGWAST